MSIPSVNLALKLTSLFLVKIESPHSLVNSEWVILQSQPHLVLVRNPSTEHSPSVLLDKLSPRSEARNTIEQNWYDDINILNTYGKKANAR